MLLEGDLDNLLRLPYPWHSPLQLLLIEGEYDLAQVVDIVSGILEL
jgi:hypothetical protein